MHRFSRTHLPTAPWKNGGGVTREVVSRPSGCGLDSFIWRVSIAEVSADGPFSVFAGVDRVIVLLEGNGVLLHAADGTLRHRLEQVFAPFAFSGDERLVSSLVDGPCSDFNVMTRRSGARADVRAVRASEVLAECRAGVLYVARGRWSVRSAGQANLGTDQAQTLEAGEGCWWEDEPRGWRVETNVPDAVLLVVHVHSPSGADSASSQGLNGGVV